MLKRKHVAPPPAAGGTAELGGHHRGLGSIFALLPWYSTRLLLIIRSLQCWLLMSHGILFSNTPAADRYEAFISHIVPRSSHRCGTGVLIALETQPGTDHAMRGCCHRVSYKKLTLHGQIPLRSSTKIAVLSSPSRQRIL